MSDIDQPTGDERRLLRASRWRTSTARAAGCVFALLVLSVAVLAEFLVHIGWTRLALETMR